MYQSIGTVLRRCVWANSGYGSHYVIRNNAVIWLEKIDQGRHSEYADVERARMLGFTSSRQALKLQHPKLRKGPLAGEGGDEGGKSHDSRQGEL